MKRYKTLFRVICAVLCLLCVFCVSVLAVDDVTPVETSTAPTEETTPEETAQGLYGAVLTFLTFFFPDDIVTAYSTTFSKLAIIVTIISVWWLLNCFLRAVGLVRRRKGI